jgi:hypothetical protein
MGEAGRGQLLDARLRRLLDDADDVACRRAAVSVSRLAVERAGVEDARLASALTVATSGPFGESAVRRSVEVLTQELDGTAWDAQGQGDASGTGQAVYVAAFRKARAANSVWSALDLDPMEAATEATYEAVAATDDVEAVHAALLASIG